MFETTGLYGKSNIYKNIDMQSGKYEKSYSFDNSIFAEGSVVFENELYVLTYKENKVLIFDPDTLKQKRELVYNRQGWGLTTDGKYLIASDGSSEIFFMDKNLNTIKQITVTRDGSPVKNINELEYIDGRIWANEWLTSNILIINPESGNVVKQLDFSKICNNHNTGTNDVLNGIAYNEKTKKIYITGKRWDTLYELEIKQ
jgi:glutamine cyclotransferase